MLTTKATCATQVDIDAGEQPHTDDLHLLVRGHGRDRTRAGRDTRRAGIMALAPGAEEETDAEIEGGRGPEDARNPFEADSDGEQGHWGMDAEELDGALVFGASAWGEDEREDDARGRGEERLLGRTDGVKAKAKAKRGRMRTIKAKLQNLPAHLSRLRARKASRPAPPHGPEEGAFVALHDREHGEDGLQPAAQDPFGDEHAAPGSGDPMDELATWNGFREGADAEMASPPRSPTHPNAGVWTPFLAPEHSGMPEPPRTPSPSKSSPRRTSFSTSMSASPRTSTYSRRSSVRAGGTPGSVHSSASKSSGRRQRSGSQGKGKRTSLKNGVSPEKVRQAAKRRGRWSAKSQLKLMQVLGPDAAGAVARKAGGVSEGTLRMAHFDRTMKDQLRRQT
ncbi:hypothetical protein C8Q80DRAFT_1274992 [Daedaleopsis nitida]|nr:hypothetical protein C8Q80DRAFT_1274992 [Daedaleopsis nitida]